MAAAVIDALSLSKSIVSTHTPHPTTVPSMLSHASSTVGSTVCLLPVGWGPFGA